MFHFQDQTSIGELVVRFHIMWALPTSSAYSSMASPVFIEPSFYCGHAKLLIPQIKSCINPLFFDVY